MPIFANCPVKGQLKSCLKSQPLWQSPPQHRLGLISCSMGSSSFCSSDVVSVMTTLFLFCISKENVHVYTHRTIKCNKTMCYYLVSICVSLIVSGPILYMYTPLQNSSAIPKIRQYTELPRVRKAPNPSACPPILSPSWQ